MAEWGDNSVVLKDVTNMPTNNAEMTGDTSEAKPAAGSPQTNEEAAEEARKKGWTAPTQYDYTKYNAAPPKEGEAQDDQPEWAGTAAKYEWSDEYGDIGPPNKELEQMLFHGDYINRTGLKIEK